MKRILYICPYLSIGGTEKHLLDLVKGFSRKYQLFLLAPPGETLEQFQSEGIAYYSFPRLEQEPLTGIKTFYKHLKRILREQQIDLIHIHAAAELVLLTRLVARRIPIVFTVHGYHGSMKGWDYWLAARISNCFATRVVTVARAEEDILLKKGIRSSKIQTILNGVPDPFKLKLQKPEILKDIPEDGTIIGAIARLETTKGLTYLFQAFQEVFDKYQRLSLVIVGAGSKEAELKREVEELGISQNTIFTGYQKNIHDFLHCFDILVIPSLHEAHPLVLLEGTGHGKPIIATGVGGIPEVIEDGINGLLIPPADPGALVAKLTLLLEDAELRNRLGRNSRKTYEEKFAVSRMLLETEKLYQATNLQKG